VIVLGVKPGLVMDPMLRDVQRIRTAAESPALQRQPGPTDEPNGVEPVAQPGEPVVSATGR
jgi:hypothetical protein